MKRTVILIAFFLLNSIIINAQENYKKSLKGIKQVRIEINTEVNIVVGVANEFVISEIKSSREHDDDHDAHSDGDKQKRKNKAKGLKAIYSGGEDNTGFGFSIEQDGDVLRIKDLKSFIQRDDLQITIPKNMDIYLDCGNLGGAKVEGFSSEIEVNTNVGDIDLVDVTGPITVHTATGTINVKFSAVNQSAPISISSATGEIDVSLPGNTKANLELKSTMGNVYTDFDLERPREDGLKNVGATRKIVAKLNNGGVKIVLRSATGNVYLRKN